MALFVLDNVVDGEVFERGKVSEELRVGGFSWGGISNCLVEKARCINIGIEKGGSYVPTPGVPVMMMFGSFREGIVVCVETDLLSGRSYSCAYNDYCAMKKSTAIFGRV